MSHPYPIGASALWAGDVRHPVGRRSGLLAEVIENLHPRARRIGTSSPSSANSPSSQCREPLQLQHHKADDD
jgi:hypothetical protein